MKLVDCRNLIIKGYRNEIDKAYKQIRNEIVGLSLKSEQIAKLRTDPFAALLLNHAEITARLQKFDDKDTVVAAW